MEDYVTFEVAQLLKEKGFDEGAFKCYDADGKEKYALYKCNSELPQDVYSKASLWNAQKWLKEKHNIFVSAWPFPITKPSFDIIWVFRIQSLNSFKDFVSKFQDINKEARSFSSYEEALNKGIKETLKFI